MLRISIHISYTNVHLDFKHCHYCYIIILLTKIMTCLVNQYVFQTFHHFDVWSFILGLLLGLPSLTINLYTVCYCVFVDIVDSSHLFVCLHKNHFFMWKGFLVQNSKTRTRYSDLFVFSILNIYLFKMVPQK